jgi:hypothetical protein
MSEKTFKIVGNDISDGYHTFDELYEHRCLLFLALLKTEYNCRPNSYGFDTYRVLNHFDGWDLIVALIGNNQISYHVPAKYRAYSDWIVDLPDDEHQWDGHTSADVVERLKEFLT